MTMYVGMHACMYVYMYIHIHIRLYIHIYIHIWGRRRGRVRSCAVMCAWEACSWSPEEGGTGWNDDYTCMYVCMYVYIYKYKRCAHGRRAHRTLKAEGGTGCVIVEVCIRSAMTHPYFVRCTKPNNTLAPDEFNGATVLRQVAMTKDGVER